MKKLLVLAVALGISQPAMAGSINTLQNLAQSEFRNFSEDLGSALSYKGVTPAESLGVTGFDLGVEVSQTSLAKSSALWSKVGTGSLSNLYIPKLHIAKGLPLDVDVAAFISSVPTTGISVYGGELRWAFVPGSLTLPAVAVRGSLTKLSGVSQLSLDTKAMDISISKGFAMFTPYAGYGKVWTNSTPNAGSLTKESFSQTKMFAGGNLNLGLTNLAAEYDKTGEARTISLKLGFRF